MEDGAPAPGESLATAETLAHLLRQIDRLTPREGTVLRLHYGLGGKDPLTFQQIGEQLQLTRERVRQIERTALDKLAGELSL